MEMTAQELIDGGYYQISRKHRILARLPSGKTGKQALLDHALAHQIVPEPETWVSSMDEYSAGHQYLCQAPTEDTVHVPHDVFTEYRRLGGGTYLAKDLDRRIHEEMERSAGVQCLKLVREIASSACARLLDSDTRSESCLKIRLSDPEAPLCWVCRSKEVLIDTHLLVPDTKTT